MFAPIRILPEALINKIAAGEVIERPASLVKELMENSLDAGAGEIIVEIKESGRSLIRVTDNGRGMSREELRLAVTRHATSKISEEADLFNLTSLGFRGEALPSIAAVTKMDIVSRKPEEMEGARLTLLGGAVERETAVGAPAGTQVEARDLFFNTPARLKFLKGNASEFGHILQVFWRLALVSPAVAFQLLRDGKKIVQLPPASKLRERAARYWKTSEDKLTAIAYSDEYISIQGFLGPGKNAELSAQTIFFYVNRRYIQERTVNFTLKDLFKTSWGREKPPPVILYLELPPHLADFNVHPAKLEARFANPRLIYTAVRRAVEEALREASAGRQEDVPFFSVPAGAASVGTAAQAPLFPTLLPAAQLSRITDLGLGAGDSLPPFAYPESGTAAPAPSAPGAVTGNFSALRIIGQFQASFIVCEAPDGILFIDQHAAHERVTFEKLKKEYAAGGLARQQLLFPEEVELDYIYHEIMKELEGSLKSLGLEVVPFGGKAWNIISLPALLPALDARELLQQIIEEAMVLMKSARGTTIADAVLKLLACRSSIMAGQELREEEMRGLLKELDEFGAAGRCPHGRPFYRLISQRDLRRMFGRP